MDDVGTSTAADLLEAMGLISAAVGKDEPLRGLQLQAPGKAK